MAFKRAIKSRVVELSLPTFLVPAFAPRCPRTSYFSTTSTRRSRIGSAPISIPSEVKFRFIQPPAVKTVSNSVRNNPSEEQISSRIEVEGPLGKLGLDIPSFVKIQANETATAQTVSVEDELDKHQKAMWGTIRSLISNTVLGVSEGHTSILRLVGVGFRATIESESALKIPPEYPGQKYVSLKVGYSHPIELGIPFGVEASAPQPTRILLKGCEKDVLKHFAARIRAWRKPEPYKGKGIFIDDETIKLKAKKIK